MNRSLIFLLIAILLILASAMTLGAQGRGHFGGGRGFGGFNTTPVVRPGPGPVVRPPFAVAPVHGPTFGFRPVHPFHPVRPVYAAPVFTYYSPYVWPTTIYGASPYSIYPGPAYSYPDPAYAYPNTAQPAVSQNEIDLAYQVGQLSAQVAQLQQQQQQQQQQQAQGVNSYTQPSVQPQASTPQITAPTVLVFRDGRRMEIQNYAIVGDTLWVLDERSATKIPLSDLDLGATQNENHSRGMRFLLPQK